MKALSGERLLRPPKTLAAAPLQVLSFQPAFRPIPIRQKEMFLAVW